MVAVDFLGLILTLRLCGLGVRGWLVLLRLMLDWFGGGCEFGAGAFGCWVWGLASGFPALAGGGFRFGVWGVRSCVSLGFERGLG